MADNPLIYTPLTRGDFLVLKVERQKTYRDPIGEKTLEYFGLGRVLTADLRGYCLTYEDWRGNSHTTAREVIAQTWAIQGLGVVGDAMWDAWKARGGMPFVTLGGVTDFVRDFRLRDLARS